MPSNQSISTRTTASVSTASSSKTLFPKKLFMPVSPATTAEDLKAMLEYYYGRINNVHIHTNQYGQAMAFIGFRRHEDAAYALEDLKGYPYEGLILHPQWATPRKKENKNETKRRCDPSDNTPGKKENKKETKRGCDPPGKKQIGV